MFEWDGGCVWWGEVRWVCVWWCGCVVRCVWWGVCSFIFVFTFVFKAQLLPAEPLPFVWLRTAVNNVDGNISGDGWPRHVCSLFVTQHLSPPQDTTSGSRDGHAEITLKLSPLISSLKEAESQHELLTQSIITILNEIYWQRYFNIQHPTNYFSDLPEARVYFIRDTNVWFPTIVTFQIKIPESFIDFICAAAVLVFTLVSCWRLQAFMEKYYSIFISCKSIFISSMPLEFVTHMHHRHLVVFPAM